MNTLIQTCWFPIAPLSCSNVFVTFAWYGHLKHKDKPLILAILSAVAFTFLPKE